MKNFKKALQIVCAISFSFLALSTVSNENVTYAAASAQRLELGVDTGTAEFRESAVYLNQTEQTKKDFIRAIKEVRSEAWNDNPPYTYDTSNPKNTKLRQILKKDGITDKRDYMNGVEWNYDLEKIAIQRAYEVALTEFWFARPDGRSYISIVDNDDILIGQSSGIFEGEASPEDFVYLWSFESFDDSGSDYDDLYESNGVFNDYNSAVWNTLSPYVTQIGYAAVYIPETNETVGVLITSGGLTSKDKATGFEGWYKLYVGNPKVGALSESEKAPLRKAKMRAEAKIEIIYDMLEKYPKTVADISDQLYELIWDSEDLMRQATGMLGDYRF